MELNETYVYMKIQDLIKSNIPISESKINYLKYGVYFLK